MSDGWIKLWRKSLDSGLLQNHELWAFWCWCLMKATHKPFRQMVGYQKIELEPGQFIFGRKAAAKELKLTERKVRTCLAVLENLENLTIKATNKFSIITVKNWNTYQQDETVNDQQNDHQATSKRPSSDHQPTTNKNVKNVRMEEEEKTYSASDDAAHAGGNGSETFFLTRRKRKLKGKRLETFNRFWEVFAYKRGKAEAADAWMDIPTLTESIVEDICAAAHAESSTRQQVIAEGRTPKMAQGWITGRRWEDEDLKPTSPEDHLKIKYAAFLAEDDGGIKQ